MKKRLINCFLIACCFCLNSFSQELDLPLGRLYNQYYEKEIYAIDSVTFHTSFRPFNSEELFQEIYPDKNFNLTRVGIDNKFKRFINVIGYDDMLRFDEHGFIKATTIDTTIYNYNNEIARNEKKYVPRKFYIAANPLFRMEAGYELLRGKVPGEKVNLNGSSDFITYNMRGIELKANIGRKVSLYTAFMENQAKFPYLEGLHTRAIQAAPGEGKTKNFKGTGFDFATAIGYISYSPNKYFNVKMGHGKHFIGDGYRSLLLSDNAFNYPYIQLTTKFWKIKYVNIFSELQANVSSEEGFDRGVDRKLANFNYVTADLTPWMEIGIFEGIIWRRTTPEGNTAFDYNFLNPIIGVRAFQKNLDNKRIYGLNYRFSIPKNMVVYGQFAVDQLKGGFKSADLKAGFQVGYKYYEAFGVDNLNLQVEFNRVRPYTYSGEDTIINFSHYSQPLAHPLGANFTEVLGIVNYRYKRFYGEWKLGWYQQGLDYIDRGTAYFNSGSNIFVPQSFFGTDDVSFGQGVNINVIKNEIRTGFILNPKINLCLEGKIQNRFYKFDNDVSIQSHIITLGLISNLFNQYYDFTLGPIRF